MANQIGTYGIRPADRAHSERSRGKKKTSLSDLAARTAGSIDGRYADNACAAVAGSAWLYLLARLANAKTQTSTLQNSNRLAILTRVTGLSEGINQQGGKQGIFTWKTCDPPFQSSASTQARFAGTLPCLSCLTMCGLRSSATLLHFGHAELALRPANSPARQRHGACAARGQGSQVGGCAIVPAPV
eukprot:2203914-Rhodomonas_salina.2